MEREEGERERERSEAKLTSLSRALSINERKSYA
jgi:hypothetical protein